MISSKVLLPLLCVGTVVVVGVCVMFPHESRLEGAVLLEEGNWRGTARCAFSPDGKSLAIARGREVGELFLFDLKTKQSATLLRQLPSCASIDFSHNGKWIAVGCGDGNVYLWDVLNGKKQQFFEQIL